MASATEAFASVANFSATIEANVDGDDIVGSLIVTRNSKGAPIRSGSTRYPYQINVSGSGWGGKTVEGQWGYDMRGSGTQKRTVVNFRVKNVPAGAKSVTASVSMNFGSGVGTRQSTPGPLSLMVGGPPLKPANPTASRITRTSMRVSWIAPSANLSPITGFEVVKHTVAGSVGGDLKTVQPDVRFLDFDNLAPDTRYYYRVRAINALGKGPWSEWVYFTTTTALGPQVSAVSSDDGSATEVSATPGTTLGLVEKYQAQRRYVGPAIPNPPGVLTFDLPATGTTRLLDATPGATYEYRARALVDGAYGPWSAWLAVTQKLASFPRGRYFDGSFAATSGGDVEFRWAGTTDLSPSEQIAPAPEGWAAFPTDSFARDSTGVVFSTRDGVDGGRALRVLFFSDATAREVRILSNSFPVDAAGRYYGKIRFRSSKIKLFVAVLRWRNAANTVLRVDFSAVRVASTGPRDWNEVLIDAEAPAGATQVAFGIADSNSTETENPLWKAGDTLDIDHAAVFFGQDYPYFDGSSTTPGYAFHWDGLENASRSYREDAPVDESLVLVDPDGIPVPPPPRPPAVLQSNVDDAGLWNRYWTRFAPALGTWSEAVPTIWLEALLEAERQVRVRWFRIEGYWRPVYSEWATQFTNLFTNPSLDFSSITTGAITTNLAQGPYPVEGAGWTAEGNGQTGAVVEDVLSPTVLRPTLRSTRDSTDPVEAARIANFYRVGTKASDTPQIQTDAIQVVAGSRYTLSVQVRSTYANPVYRISVGSFASEGGGVWYEETFNTLTTPANQWRKLTTTTPPVETGVIAIIMTVDLLTPNGAAPVAGGQSWISEVMAQEGLAVEDYYDGNGSSETADPDFIYTWAGAVGASVSQKRARIPTGVESPSTAARVQSSTRWASRLGGTSLVVNPRNTSTSTSAVVGGNSTTAMNAGLQAGKTYTVLAKFYQEAPQTGSISSSYGRRIRVAYNTVAGTTGEVEVLSEAAPNVGGEVFEARLTFTLPANAVWARIFLGNGAALGGGDVYWDDVMILEGTYDGEWFDGGSVVNEDLRRTVWLGEPNQSQSALQTRTRSEIWYEPTAEEVDPKDFVGEQVISYLPTGGEMVLDGIDRHAWFEKNNGVTIPADHLLSGTGGQPASWPTLDCGSIYYLTVDVPTSSPPGNLKIAQGITAVVI